MLPIFKNYNIHKTYSVEELKKIWQEIVPYMAYDPDLLPKKTRDGITYLYSNQISDQQRHSELKGKYFNFRDIKSNQLLSDNVFENYKYYLTTNMWPREKYQYLIISKQRRNQRLTTVDKNLIYNLMTKNIKIWFNLHWIVVNHWHMHIVIKKPDYDNYINNSMFTLKHEIIQDTDFNTFFNKVLLYQKKKQEKSFSFNFFKRNNIFHCYVIFKDQNNRTNGRDIHNDGFICINNYMENKCKNV